MKIKELNELRESDSTVLSKKLEEMRTELMNLRFTHATGALENASILAQKKRDIARVLTLINEKRAAK